MINILITLSLSLTTTTGAHYLDNGHSLSLVTLGYGQPILYPKPGVHSVDAVLT